MTKLEAVRSLNEGKLITHKYFISGDYGRKSVSELVDETDQHFTWKEFWGQRTIPAFDNDWEIYDPDEDDIFLKNF